MDMMSCDTMVAVGNSTLSGNVIFAKNSDRPVTESQPLVTYKGAKYDEGSMLSCTYIDIPQVPETYRVMGSKPYWIWGFEHGMNEHNVVIGNEAVWGREGEETENGLLGMDLLRLALERSKTAYEALHVITDLLVTYGQGGNAAVGMEHRYCNAFLIADPTEAWVLDTCNRRWVARKVKDVAGISNCYSTEEEWDEDSGDIEQHAYEMGWISEEVPFNFAKAYSHMSLKHRAAHPRWARLNKLLNHDKGGITIETMRQIQRDHFEGEIIEPRWSPSDGLHVSICMHNMLDTASKTAAAAHIEIKEGEENVWWNAYAVPCMSVFAPYTISAELPEIISTAGAKYSDDSAWWRFERLQYAIEQDYFGNMMKWKPIQNALEYEFLQQMDEGMELTTTLIMENTEKMLDAVDAMYEEIIHSDEPIVDIQHKEMNEVNKQRAGIVF